MTACPDCGKPLQRAYLRSIARLSINRQRLPVPVYTLTCPACCCLCFYQDAQGTLTPEAEVYTTSKKTDQPEPTGKPRPTQITLF